MHKNNLMELLDRIDRDITDDTSKSEVLLPLPLDLINRMESLVSGIEVDIDAPLPDDDQ